MIYGANGWLHDVIAIEEFVSITWNFVRRNGSREFTQYLENGWQKDSEFLQYFHQSAGVTEMSAEQIADLHFSAV